MDEIPNNACVTHVDINYFAFTESNIHYCNKQVV